MPAFVKHKIGSRVFTMKIPPTATDWTEEAGGSRKWGVLGTVVIEHNSHGLCYEVKHDDGTYGAYEPHELQRVVVGLEMPVGSVGVTISGNFPGRWVRRIEHYIVSNDRACHWQSVDDVQIRIVADQMPNLNPLLILRSMPDYVQAKLAIQLFELVKLDSERAPYHTTVDDICATIALAPKTL